MKPHTQDQNWQRRINRPTFLYKILPFLLITGHFLVIIAFDTRSYGFPRVLLLDCLQALPVYVQALETLQLWEEIALLYDNALLVGRLLMLAEHGCCMVRRSELWAPVMAVWCVMRLAGASHSVSSLCCLCICVRFFLDILDYMSLL